ncbi:MAG: hypothetical protein LBI10_11385, partial [Deltaproteobacteria bacterium]|nr:hypothetical protein [Deltaproteobacteria bacterium]
MKSSRLTTFIFSAWLVLGFATCPKAFAVSPDKSLYQSSPFVSAYRTIPRVLLILSKDHKMFQQAYNGLIDIDGDNRIDTGFNPIAVYSGYFDPYSCYKYSTTPSRAGNEKAYFSRAKATIQDNTQEELNSAKNSAIGSVAKIKAARSTTGICQAPHSSTSSSDTFSGNWLNYLTMSRMDVIRKILYGGHRIVDTANTSAKPGGETVLLGSFVTRDSNSWGTDVVADNRWVKDTPMNVYYDISKYTPFPKPTNGTAHYFCRVKNTTGSYTINFPVFEYILNAKASTFKSSTKITGEGRYFDWVLQEGPNPSTSSLNNPANDLKSYTVRVKVCEKNNIGDGEDCREYPDGSLKPVGLLQKNGENGDMYFGLLSGTFDNDTSNAHTNVDTRNQGGVIRNHIDHLSTAVNLENGLIKSGGLIWSLDTFTIAGFALRSGSTADGQQKYNNSSSWGNPIGEMLYEGVRYFGKIGPTPTLQPTASFLPATEFSYNAYDTSKKAALTKNWNSLPTLPAGECSKPIILLISEVVSEMDGDTAINSGDGGLNSATLSTIKGETFPAFNLATYLQKITDHEKLNTGKTYFYSTGRTNNCHPKTLNSLSEVKGLCPYRPSFEGSYSAAAVAYFAHTHNFGVADRELGLDVYTVTMSAAFPSLEFPIMNSDGEAVKKITILPASMSQSSATFTNGRILSFLNYYILEWWVDENGTPYHVKIKVNYEDSAVGYSYDSSWPLSDWDMDVLIEYTVDLVTQTSPNRDNATKINYATTSPASGALKVKGGEYYKFKSQDTPFAISPSEIVGLSIKSWKINNSTDKAMGLGYSISGSTHDGTYMDVMHFGGVATYSTPRTCNWPKGYGVDSAAHKGTNCFVVANSSNPSHGVGDAESFAAIRTFEFADSSASSGEFLENPLYLAAKYGGFKDSNYNGKPDAGEWEGSDGSPKNYFQATNITELPAKLEAAFQDIARSVSSGTATSASVNSVLGGGISIQTAFYPMYVDPKNPAKVVNWVGTVYGLFVDKFGNLREDSNQDGDLDDTDYVITFNSVKSPPDPEPACYAPGEAISLCSIDYSGKITQVISPSPANIHKVKSLWDVGKQLATVQPASRTIYYVNPDSNSIGNFTDEAATVAILQNYLLHDNFRDILPDASPSLNKNATTAKLVRY